MLDQAAFENLRDDALKRIVDTLKSYVDDAPDREQLLLVVYISGEEATIDPSTRSGEIEKLSLTAKETHGEQNPQLTGILSNLSGRAWPTIPILLIRNEPEGLTFFQLFWCVYQEGGGLISKGGDA